VLVAGFEIVDIKKERHSMLDIISKILFDPCPLRAVDSFQEITGHEW